LGRIQELLSLRRISYDFVMLWSVWIYIIWQN
jgi:hypothetical protein